MDVQIEYVDPVWCRVHGKEAIQELRKVLFYPRDVWLRNRFGRTRKKKIIPCVSAKGWFLTGFLPRVLDSFKSAELSGLDQALLRVHSTWVSPHLPGITLREDQAESVKRILLSTRGVVHAPTGAGKTILAMSILSAFPRSNGLIIIDPTGGLGLLNQTYKEALRFFPANEVGIIGEGNYQPKRITVGLINSLVRVIGGSLQPWLDSLEVIMVDECHACSSFSGMYHGFLTSTLAPVRVGFTGTLPVDSEAKMALEGLIGPVIVKVEEDDLEQKEIIAEVKVRLISLPHVEHLWSMKYQEAYTKGIVQSKSRNRRVLDEVKRLVMEDNRTVLVIVYRVEHGENLLAMASRMFNDLRVKFIDGRSDGDVREFARQSLNSGNTDVVITTTVWKQGIDIPNLGSIVNAAMGKSEIQCLQFIGRGRRATLTKKDLILVDFVDSSSRYFADHFVRRFQI